MKSFKILFAGGVFLAGAHSVPACSNISDDCHATLTCPVESSGGSASTTGGQAAESGAPPQEEGGRRSLGGATSSGGVEGSNANGGMTTATNGGSGVGGSSGQGEGGDGTTSAGGTTTHGGSGTFTGGTTSTGGALAGGTTSRGGATGNSSGGVSGGSPGAGGTSDGDTTPPSIVSVSPANNATGVTSNTQIKITFSEAMNTASVTQALKVGSFAAGDLTVSWDTSGKVLTVTPKGGFAYAEGTTPAGTPATKYAVTLGNGAQDLAGNTLPAFGSNFSTLRRISQAIPSSSVATYTTYSSYLNSDPAFCPEFEPQRVGDWCCLQSSGTSYVFAAFDTEVMGTASSIITLEKATLSATQLTPEGDFYATRKVGLKKLKYQPIDKTILDAVATDNLGIFSMSSAAQPTTNVHSFLFADISANTRKQLYRLEPTVTAQDSAFANFSCTGFTLNVVFLSP